MDVWADERGGYYVCVEGVVSYLTEIIVGNVRVYPMNQRVISLVKRLRGVVPVCKTCGLPIEVGESAVSKVCRGRGGLSVRHEACARRVHVL